MINETSHWNHMSELLILHSFSAPLQLQVEANLMKYCIFTAIQRSFGKVMFSVVSVCQSVILSVGRRQKCIQWNLFHYLPPTKLWEDNVFTGVCHSVQRRGPMWQLRMKQWTSLYKAAPRMYRSTTQGPAPLLLVTSGGQDWGHL